MRMFKKVLAGFVAAAMVATMAGCGSSNSSTKDSGSDKAAAEATTEAAAPAKVLNTNAANKLIYCITPSTSNPYFGTVQTACKEEGEKLGYKVNVYLMMMMLQNSPNYSIQLFPKAHPQSIVITPEQMLLSKQFRKLMMLESLHSWLTVRSTKKVFAYLRS